MPFKFSLETLMRLREIAEQREERLLGQILNQIVQSRKTLADLANQRKNVLERRDAAIVNQTSAFEINGYYQSLTRVDALEKTGVDHLAKLEILRDQQAKVYEAAHRQTELLSGMRAKYKENYHRELDKQEQKAMDDNFSSRRNMKQATFAE